MTRYRVIMEQANRRLKTDLAKAATALSEQVEKAAVEGWRPQGGLS